MSHSAVLEEKLRVQARLSAACPSMADYLAHNEETARDLARTGRTTLRYHRPLDYSATYRPAGLVLREKAEPSGTHSPAPPR